MPGTSSRTRVVRLPVSLLDALAPEAEAAGCSIGDLIAAKLTPTNRQAIIRANPIHVAVDRCQCPTPDPTRYGVCRTCKRIR